ncbi:MAG: assimilatory sulfite reductase (NADPH) flavoprotein subunit [Archangium sp.]|nr:assimilatory sulfite reductase (NADPH) flavoprotein subunit [Archangium sp.]
MTALPLKPLLRLAVVGSVDDGKSTLIGRLLYECDALFDDQIASVKKATSKRAADTGELDFSLFTDGLLAEREQGITIDVAYRYFSTNRRTIIVADTPGHVQYTRNMATGASTADAAVILIDARLGVLPQTRRHAYIASLLRVPYLAVAVNKMDLVDFDPATFTRIGAELLAFTSTLGFKEVRLFPVSARSGDNLTQFSQKTPWHQGGTLLGWLESLPHEEQIVDAPLRFPVQTVLRPHLDYRAFAGQVASGEVKVGDELVALPSGARSIVTGIDTFDGELTSASAPASVAIRLKHDIDLSRGDVLVHPARLPLSLQHFEANLVWFGEKSLEVGRRYLIKHTTRTVSAQVDRVISRKELEDLSDAPAETLALNDIGRVRITSRRPLLGDRYVDDRRTGAFIVIDPLTNDTVATGMILGPSADQSAVVGSSTISSEQRKSRLGHPGAIVLAPSEADAVALERQLFEAGVVASLARDGAVAVALAEAGLCAIAWAGTPQARRTIGDHARDAGVTFRQLDAKADTAALLGLLLPPKLEQPASGDRVTILYGSQTGNSRALAERLHQQLEAAGVEARVLRTGEYPVRELAKETLLYVVISTQGDGDPPDDAKSFVDFVVGKRAPQLPQLQFGVLGLGDTSYTKFCEIGRVLDARFAALGATRVVDAGECDVDFETVGAPWVVRALTHAQKRPGTVTATKVHVTKAIEPRFHREAPFAAEIYVNQRIVSRDALKDVRHLEVSLGASGLTYEPGDSLGIWPRNAPELVKAVLSTQHFDADLQLSRDEQRHPLSTWLASKLELTRLTKPFLVAHAALAKSAELDHAIGTEELRELLDTHQVIDVLRRYPAAWEPEAFVHALRKMSPRLYSIASSQKRVGAEAHLTVAHVAYQAFGDAHFGAASHHLATRAVEDLVPVFVESNPRFRVPADPSRDCIMIGPGTGVAPFRAFVQERAEVGAKGRNWLFFGEQHFRAQFLYQVEWQEALKRGHLSRLSLAFSRDQAQKIYVQHRMREAGKDLFAWLEGGAHLSVCGEATRMANDVNEALLAIVEEHGGKSREDAEAYVAQLRDSQRYQRDVY